MLCYRLLSLLAFVICKVLLPVMFLAVLAVITVALHKGQMSMCLWENRHRRNINPSTESWHGAALLLLLCFGQDMLLLFAISGACVLFLLSLHVHIVTSVPMHHIRCCCVAHLHVRTLFAFAQYILKLFLWITVFC